MADIRSFFGAKTPKAGAGASGSKQKATTKVTKKVCFARLVCDGL